MKTKLDRRLNMVLEVEAASGVLHVHSAPIAHATYEMYYRVLSRSVTQIYSDGLSVGMGARVGMYSLLDVAKQISAEQVKLVEEGLLPELWRLANVGMLTPSGWTPIPLVNAVANGTLSGEDAKDVQNAICFFTAASWVHPMEELQTILYPGMKNFGVRITSSNSTEYLASLPTSTPQENTGGTATAPSIPS